MSDWIKAVDEPKIFQAHTDTETEKKVQKLMNAENFIRKFYHNVLPWLRALDEPRIFQPHTDTVTGREKCSEE